VNPSRLTFRLKTDDHSGRTIRADTLSGVAATGFMDLPPRAAEGRTAHS
jgi:hypothetical protein